MGFFEGLGRYIGPRRRRRRGLHLGPEDGGFDEAAADADATRARLSDHLYEGVSRVPGGDDGEDVGGPDARPMPDERPDPRAQWDGVRGCWILWDPDSQSWEPIGAQD